MGETIRPNINNDFMFRKQLMSDEKKRYAELQQSPDGNAFTEGGVQEEKIEYFTD